MYYEQKTGEPLCITGFKPIKNRSLLNSIHKRSLACSSVMKYFEHVNIRSFHTP